MPQERLSETQKPPEGHPRLTGRVRGEPCVGNGETSDLAGLD